MGACAKAGTTSKPQQDMFGNTATAGSGSGTGNGGLGDINGSGNDGVPAAAQACGTGGCEDFPADPIFDHEKGSAPPSDAAKHFGKAGDFAAPGACVLEPQLSEGKQPGALFPRNWLRPRFRFVPQPGEDLWEIRLHAAAEKHDLVAYTTRTTWILPRDVWKGLSAHVIDQPIDVTIRGVSSSASSKPSGVKGSFTIAPAEAHGKLVYWATTSSEVKPDTSKLVGFDVGDEGVIDALTVPQVGQRNLLAANGRDPRGKYDDPKGVAPGAVECIGCHNATPDGDAVAFTDHWPWNSVLAEVKQASAGAQPSYVSAGAQLLLNQPWLGMTAFSKAHWKSGDRVQLAVYSPRNTGSSGVGFSDGAPYPSHSDGIAWFDLETKATFAADPSKGDVQQQLNDAIAAQRGKAFDLLALDGETRSAAAPSWSHDGTRIVYTSADQTQDGRLSGNNNEIDLHIVPYADRKGGKVSELKGAAEPHVAEYYPAFSADDSLVAFTRVANLDGAPMYYRPDGEVYVVDSDGGTPVRVAGNDPPACSGEKSPGVINSWPKWSPVVSHEDPDTQELGFAPRAFYWLVFSSARDYEGQFELPRTQYSPPDTRSSQLYVSAVVRDEKTGELTTYPAIYLWNQAPDTSNLTPAWDVLQIPPVPGPE
ncbi:MAG TPA: hypothetical protein VHM19_19350 [Polyangiales bacterium]|nr:hypothetical protein [Polyangiales bacterium]